MVHLADPGLPDSSLDQMVYTLLEASGLTFLIGGPWDLADTVKEVVRVSPFFAASVPLENGLAAHPAHGSIWTGLDGPLGSAVLLFVAPGDGGAAANIMGELRGIEARWQRFMVNRGDLEPIAAEYLKGAAAVPAWEFLAVPEGRS